MHQNLFQDPDGVSRACTVFDSSSKIGDDANSIVAAAAAKAEDQGTDVSVDKWHYVKV